MNLLYKELGETPNETILRFKKENPEFKDVTMTYAGRLDPMAEGLLLVLSGSELHEKEKYLNLPKTYVFEVLWGFQTDTLDVLGKVTNFKNLEVSESNLKNKLKESIAKFVQSYPAYSSKPVSGKPLFKWAREGRLSQIEIPSHEVELYRAKFLKRETISKKELLKQLEEKVSKVSGDFRQDEILKIWKEKLKATKEEKFTVDTVEVEVSSGFYVRQFIADLSKGFGGFAVAFHIKRTRVGEYSV